MLAALLHDIGYWILIQECPRELEQAIELALAAGIPLPQAEYEILGASHAEIGAYLLAHLGSAVCGGGSGRPPSPSHAREVGRT